jgi:hypothetical protein
MLWRIDLGKKPIDRTTGDSLMLSWLERLHQASAKQSERDSDPWRRVLERALPPDLTAVSTTSLCDLLGLRPTTGNARRIARTMRAMGFVPIKSRTLLPGGWRGSEGRGWARPIREPSHQTSLKQYESVKSSQPNNHTL